MCYMSETSVLEVYEDRYVLESDETEMFREGSACIRDMSALHLSNPCSDRAERRWDGQLVAGTWHSTVHRN